MSLGYRKLCLSLAEARPELAWPPGLPLANLFFVGLRVRCWQQIKATAPLYTPFSEGTGGAPKKGKTLSHADVMRLATWPTISAILKKEYVEV